MSDKMSKEELEQRVRELEKEREERKKVIRQYNENAKKNWDNFSCRVPKGTKEKITSKNFSVNGLVNKLLLSALSSLGTFTAETKERAESIDFVVLPILHREDLENCHCMGVDEKVVENLSKHDVTPEIVANDALDRFIGFLEGMEEDERMERERMVSEPPKQARTATKTSQTDILPYGNEKGQETENKKPKQPHHNTIVKVGEKEVVLWLDADNSITYTDDIEQLEAFRVWKASQMPDIAKTELEEREEPEQEEESGLTSFEDAIKEVLTRDREPKRTELEEMHYQANKIMRSIGIPYDDYERFPQTDIKEFKKYLKDKETEEFKEFLTDDYKYNFQAKAGYANFERFMSAVADELGERIKEESHV